jgi:hypothetical protein
MRAWITTAKVTTSSRLLSTLAGTVPRHQCYILLHSPQPPSEFPAKLTSDVYRELLVRARKWGGLVNFSWFPDHSVRHTGGRDENDPTVYSATAFSSHGKLELPEVMLTNMDEVEEKLRNHIAGDHHQPSGSLDGHDEVYVYVCTHGARDCRCGDMGGKVVKVLREELEKRRKSNPMNVRVRIGEVGHVGGHK